MVTKPDRRCADGDSKLHEKPHKSRRKLKLRKDIDDHYWPLCKEGKAHSPSQFTLTTFACGDLLRQVGEMVHHLKKELGMPFKCKCCRDKENSADGAPLPQVKSEDGAVEIKNETSVENLTQPEEVLAEGIADKGSKSPEVSTEVEVKVEEDSKPVTGPETREETSKPVSNPEVATGEQPNIVKPAEAMEVDEKLERLDEKLKELVEANNKTVEEAPGGELCAVCTESFKERDKLNVGLHLIKHFKDELQGEKNLTEVKREDREGVSYQCRHCDHAPFTPVSAAMIHVGFEHNEFDRYILLKVLRPRGLTGQGGQGGPRPSKFLEQQKEVRFLRIKGCVIFLRFPGTTARSLTWHT